MICLLHFAAFGEISRSSNISLENESLVPADIERESTCGGT